MTLSSISSNGVKKRYSSWLDLPSFYRRCVSHSQRDQRTVAPLISVSRNGDVFKVDRESCALMLPNYANTQGSRSSVRSTIVHQQCVLCMLILRGYQMVRSALLISSRFKSITCEEGMKMFARCLHFCEIWFRARNGWQYLFSSRRTRIFHKAIHKSVSLQILCSHLVIIWSSHMVGISQSLDHNGDCVSVSY